MRKTTVVLMAFALLATLALPLAADHHATGSWTGWITDDHCGAQGASAGHPKSCVEKCLKEGGKLVLYNNGDQKLYGLDNQDEAMKHLGYEVKVTGAVDGDQIKVAAIERAETKAE
jgi:hypothetical protein